MPVLEKKRRAIRKLVALSLPALLLGLVAFALSSVEAVPVGSPLQTGGGAARMMYRVRGPFGIPTVSLTVGKEASGKNSISLAIGASTSRR